MEAFRDIYYCIEIESKGSIRVSIFNQVSVIIPAINETYLMRQTIEIITETCNSSDIAEILIVLCARSTKECVAGAEALKEEPRSIPVKIYFQIEPFIGAAYQEAFTIATGSHVIIMSADMETDPNQVKDLIQAQKKHPDAVIAASRWGQKNGFSGYNKIKLVLNYIFNKMLSVVYFSNLSDMTFGYKSFPRYLVTAIDWQESKHPFFLELALKPLRLGVEFYEIHSKWKVRTEGKSQNSFFQNFKYFKVVLFCRFIRKKNILKPSFDLADFRNMNTK